MKKSLIVILVIVVIVLLYSWSLYNGLVRSNEAINNQWAQVETQYQRRFDLIPNLVATVQGIAKQEQKVFGDLAKARANYAGAKTVEDKVGAANQVELSLSRLLVVVENYPQLRSSENFQTLMVQLEGTENRISVERQRFNDSVLNYNLVVKGFPGKILASLYGFKERVYFQAATGSEKAPKVNF